MNLLAQWKAITTRANQAFAHEHYEQACCYYQQAFTLLVQHWPGGNNMMMVATGPDIESLVVCLSISAQNLAEAHARQGGHRRCLSLLRRTLQRLSDWHRHQLLPPEVEEVVLGECSQLWRELCRQQQMAGQRQARLH